PASLGFQQFADGAVNREVIQPFIAAEVILVDATNGCFQARFEDRLAETAAKRPGRIIEIALNKIPLHGDELFQQRALDLRELVRVIALRVQLRDGHYGHDAPFVYENCESMRVWACFDRFGPSSVVTSLPGKCLSYHSRLVCHLRRYSSRTSSPKCS